MTHLDYWAECLSQSCEEAGIQLTSEQIAGLAKDIETAHDNIGQAFYQPPASDRYNEIEREWQRKYKSLQAEFDKYRGNAENAVKQALNQSPDAQVGIGEYGEVTRYGGRIERIQ